MAADDVPSDANTAASLTGSVETPGEPLVPFKPANSKSRRTWSDLGRQISSRTTDLLAMAIVLVVSLTMGRQVVYWWGADPPAVLDMGPLENLHTEWGAASRPVALEFGNSPYSITRQVVSVGGPQAALNAVREHCQRVLVNAGPLDLHSDAPPDAAELGQLAALSQLSPDIEQPGWQLFTLGGAMAMVVGVQTFATETEKSASASPPDRRRVVCWGLVFPGLESGSWTAYTFVRRHGAATAVSGFDLSQVALPAGCQRTVLMQEAGQSGLLGFHGRLNAAAWQRHFDSWLQARGWRPVDPWQQHSQIWTSRYVIRQTAESAESMIQIQFHLQNSDQGVGLIHWVPGRDSQPAVPPSTTRGTP